ncbi:MAG TPA: transposase, partial [Candidatus Acidoferrales bacterium]
MHRHHESIRLPSAHYLGQRRYFITMCCEKRHPLFSNPATVTLLIHVLREKSTEYNFAIDAYCAMPNHLHFLARGLNPSANLLDFIHDFKQKTAHDYQTAHGRTLWQKKFYDHILRESDHGESVANYIWQNPVRKEICNNPREYPASGSFTLDWKNLISPAA